MLRHHGPADLVLVDDSPAATGPQGTPLRTGAAGAAALAAAEVVVKSPGISRHRPDVARLEAGGAVVTGGMAIWLEAMAGTPVVGVTGTKGKSTTAALLHRLLEVAGVPATLAGNIGVPVLSLLGPDVPRPAGRVHVVEVSSYQAADVSCSPSLGVLTSLHPEHLDWHGSLDRYLDDKLNLFAHGSRDDLRVLVGPHVELAEGRLGRLPATVLRPTVAEEGLVLAPGDVLAPSQWPLAGRHNLENAALAVAAAGALGVEVAERPHVVREALEGFVPLAHRLTLLGRTDGGLDFVDDTLSTVPQSTVAALAAFGHRAVTVIVGGHDRGVDVGELAAALAGRAEPTAVACVPDTGARVAEALRAGPPSATLATEAADLDAAVAWAVRHTPPGGVVLLSPAAPSYNRYRSHEELSSRFAELLARHRSA
ncbi:MAG: UDP-N-acetylmuramoyl-L-alanine--D-glutamate ligase [Acidimicrobiia bacterium]|nr:UDP-N-acetylmuramoyl-L-alanine--D-glutamate ligase [Acidimicrobiia bacterium]